MTNDRAWWRAALAGDAPPITEEPQQGFYKRRLVRGGPFVPVSIWTEEMRDEAGDLIDEPRTLCTVDGRAADAAAHWTYCAASPISEAEFDYLSRLSTHSKAHAPREPLANPRKPIDPLKFPLPSLKVKNAPRR